MKRNLLILVIVGLVLFLGCSEQADMQTTPESPFHKSISLESTKINVNGYKYLIDEYREMNPRLYTVEKDYFLKLIYRGIETGRIIFSNEKHSTAFNNKLRATYYMIKKGNYKGAIQRINSDLLDKVDKWIDEAHKHSVGLALEKTVFILTRTCDKFYINIDYFDYCSDLNGYGWTQIVDGETHCILHLEGSNNNYLEDPVFYVLAGLQDGDTKFKTQEGMWLYSDPELTVKSGCVCPDSRNECKCVTAIESPKPAPAPEPSYFDDPFDDLIPCSR